MRGGLQTEAYEVGKPRTGSSAPVWHCSIRGSPRGPWRWLRGPGRDRPGAPSSDEIDLVLLDGRRPLLGDGVPREGVGTVLNEAPCDVAVLVAREGARVAPGRARS